MTYTESDSRENEEDEPLDLSTSRRIEMNERCCLPPIDLSRKRRRLWNKSEQFLIKCEIPDNENVLHFHEKRLSQNSAINLKSNGSLKSRSEEPTRLFRGQEIWLSPEKSPARHILKCLVCEKSFPSLPGLTAHLIEAQHFCKNDVSVSNNASEHSNKIKSPPQELSVYVEVGENALRKLQNFVQNNCDKTTFPFKLASITSPFSIYFNAHAPIHSFARTEQKVHHYRMLAKALMKNPD